MKQNKVMKRSEVPEEFTWNLKDMFESDEAWEKALEELGAYPRKLAKLQGTLGESAANLLKYYKLSDEISLKVETVYNYASMKGDEDTANSKYQDYRGKAMSAYVAIAGAGAFAGPEIMAIPDETIDGFYKEKKALLRYKVNIDRIRKAKDHILSPKEEAIMAAAAEVSSAPENINSLLQDADFKWDDVVDAKGKKHPLTNGSFTMLLEDPDQDFRKRVFEQYYKQFDAHKNTIAAAYDGHFKGLKFNAEQRHYGSTLEAALDDTEVPVEVYTNLIDAVHGNLDKMYKYVALRKKMLGVKKLHMYDVYVPIVRNAAKKISFEEAKKTVLEALSVLGKDYTDLLQEGFDNRWIDVYENEGKRGGAYSSGSSHPHPYVLLNHKDNLDSMFTLAHEMGHALHSYHSTKNQPVNTTDYVIFVAEVASTCNEVLLMKYLLSRTTDKKERMYLINHFLDAFKGTVYRQTMFAEFELMMGRAVEAGQTLTADWLCEKYLELNKLYFGPKMISDPQIALECLRIPHFFYNYYVFQYATGYSAAVAIANRILEEGEPAVKDYKKFLSGGCSTDPISLLKIAGVDMSSPEPVNSALKLFGELVDELEKLQK
ncbi:MAG: oligoendopeptidase F [Firmicutes bacterium]|nr:oligoendopeptidase F [Bacillota bacterium]MBR0482381.1 oligoendopeptidase F [Bacillota bacterium]